MLKTIRNGQKETGPYRSDAPKTTAEQAAAADAARLNEKEPDEMRQETQRPDLLGAFKQGLGEPVLDRRIRPEELAEALRSLEKRKNETYRGTLPLAETMREMQIPLSHADIWQEVQNNRASKNRQQGRKVSDAGRRYLKSAGIVGLLIVGAVSVRMLTDRESQFSSDLKTFQEQQKFQAANRFIAPPPRTDFMLSPGMFYQSPTMKPLAAVKDGEMIPMELSRIQMIGHATEPQQTLFNPMAAGQQGTEYVDTKPQRGYFHAVRLGGKWYVRGFTSAMPQKLKPAPPPVPGQPIPTYPTTLGTMPFYEMPREHTIKQVTHLKTIEQKLGNGETRTITTTVTDKLDGGPAKIPVTIPYNAIQGYNGRNIPGTLNDIEYDLTVDTAKLDKHFREMFKPLDSMAKLYQEQTATNR